MKIEYLDLVSKFFRYTLLECAALYVAAYLILVFFRIQYPFELEWFEGGSLEQIRRILSGQKLYVCPSLEFVPFIYTPLYFYLSAFVSKFLGIRFISLRLVSFTASLGCFFIIFLFVDRETKSRFSAVLASCLFAATFRISSAFFDIARVDSLFLFFLLTALYLVKFKTTLKSYILAGLFISLSFLTKQTALAMSLPILLYYLYIGWRRSFFFVGTVVVIIGLSTLLLNYIHQGWYNFYVFELPSQHSIIKIMFIDFWTKDLIASLFIACVMSVYYLNTQLLTRNKKNFIFYFLMAAGMIGLSWVSRLNLGGYPNALLPAYAVISILFGLAIHTFLLNSKATPEGKQKVREIYIYLVCIVQFCLLFYNPFDQIPTKEDVKAGRNLLNTIQQIEGDVLMPCHGYLPVLVGKNSYAHAAAIFELIGSYGGGLKEEGKKVINEFIQAAQEKRFGAIILDTPLFINLLGEHYIKQRPVFYNETVFWPVTGARFRPQIIYVPKKKLGK